ncbi:MAG: hypothetical protein EBX53_05455 [Betaproteobacteria bacterium]|nr:hypothetical protein [Betaproteobacteria bacterium]
MDLCDAIFHQARAVRAELGRRIRIHTTPELRFRYDASTERGMAMSRLIDQALGDRPAAVDDPQA